MVNPPTNPVAAATVQSYTDWPSIFAGAVFATALSFVLVTFGSAIGLSFTNPFPGEGASLRWITIAGGIWMIWVSVSSFAAGGYLAGRLRRRADDANEDEVEARDGAHGVIMWAVGVVFGSLLAVSGLGSLAGSAGSGAVAVLEATDVQVTADIDYASSTLLRGDGMASNANARDEVGTILRRGLMEGEVPEGDRAYLSTVVAQNTGLAPNDARARVDAAIDDGLATRQAALEAADQARVAGIIGAFVLAATLLVSAAAAYFAATIGGGHRDSNLGFRVYGR